MKRHGLLAFALFVLFVVSQVWATGSLTVPNTFQTQAGNVAVSQLDTNFTTFRDYINNRELTQGTFAARPAAGTSGRWYFATDTVGGTLYADNGTAWVQVAPASAAIVNSAGTARLTFISATSIQLGLGQIPMLVGSQWTMRRVTASVTISNSGLGPSTTYYVYASDTAGNTTLAITQAPHSAETTFGVETLTGNTNNTLVGMVRTDASSQFASSASHTLVNSWFARQPLVASATFSSTRATTSTTFVELGTEIRNDFVSWAGQAATVGCLLSVNSAIGDGAHSSLGFDGTNPEPRLAGQSSAGVAITIAVGFGYTKGAAQLTEGYHYVTLLGRSTVGGTATWFADPAFERFSTCTVEIH